MGLNDYAINKCASCVPDTSSCEAFVIIVVVGSIALVIAIWFSLVIRLLSVIIDNNDNKKTRHRI